MFETKRNVAGYVGNCGLGGVQATFEEVRTPNKPYSRNGKGECWHQGIKIEIDGERCLNFSCAYNNSPK